MLIEKYLKCCQAASLVSFFYVIFWPDLNIKRHSKIKVEKQYFAKTKVYNGKIDFQWSYWTRILDQLMTEKGQIQSNPDSKHWFKVSEPVKGSVI